MDAALAFRLAAAAFVAVIVVVALVDHRPTPRSQPEPSLAQTSPPAPDPRRQALAHCQSLGAAGAQDAPCLALWANERARFLGQPAAAEAR